jgi:hypothetical protein
VPNDERTSTAYGMPYFAPAWPISSIGTSTIALPSSTCDRLPRRHALVDQPGASVYDGMHMTMPTHSAA